ncbi:Tyrosine recombinase XerC [Raoultella planticola]|uniref:Tyrosine recombinase XerC n=1 Tax=Raoultella planticola TaxID=575 RepID=A0A485BG73_RAOPL|nr:Tyrosine recombinase XerC [Raoultella planticola]
MTDSPLFTAVERFLRYLGVERQLSPITLLNYRRQLDALMALAEQAGLKSWQQCDAAQVRGLAVRSRKQGLGPASLALRLSALRSFFDWLVAQGELAANRRKVSPPQKFPVTYRKILMSMTSTGCWISILTIRWRCAIGRCWR